MDEVKVRKCKEILNPFKRHSKGIDLQKWEKWSIYRFNWSNFYTSEEIRRKKDEHKSSAKWDFLLVDLMVDFVISKNLVHFWISIKDWSDRLNHKINAKLAFTYRARKKSISKISTELEWMKTEEKIFMI